MINMSDEHSTWERATDAYLRRLELVLTDRRDNAFREFIAVHCK